MGGVTVVGLGPAGLDRVAPAIRELLADPARVVVARTLVHPAAAELSADRVVVSCDDLYEAGDDFDEVYGAIAARVLEAAAAGDVVYAVPGSALVGERSVAIVRADAARAGVAVTVLPGESFLDLALERTGCDPLRRGLQVLDGRALPDPLILQVPTLIAQVDRPVVLADVQAELGRVLDGDTPVTVLVDLGTDGERVVTVPLRALATDAAGPRTSLFLDPPHAGWVGLVATNRRLRTECPWDARQTHHSLVHHLVEESYELVGALAELPPDAPGGEPDFGAYAEVEEELGDLLLQVVFHATLAAEAGAFGVEEVAEGIRRKLVARHPHVFGDEQAGSADEVKHSWERRKHDEKGRDSLMDGIPEGMPAVTRAAKVQHRAAAVGFDWPEAEPVLDKILEEVGELRADLTDPERRGEELGDLLFSVVNLARHLDVEPETALRRATDRFTARFRAMEHAAGRPLQDLSLDELEALWQAAKRLPPPASGSGAGAGAL